MPQKSGQTLLAFTLLVPVNDSTAVSEVLRTLTDTEPVIVSKPGMKVDKVITYLPPETDTTDITTRIKEIFSFPTRVQTQLIEEEEWRNKWKKYFHPFKITKTIRIVPSWIEQKRRSQLTTIILDPGYAFGTGLHETTQFMARMLEKKKKRCASFFDVGYGSGILPIIAAKLGYTKIKGIDNDENALKAAMENAKKNNVDTYVNLAHADLGSLKQDDCFDFVGANLNTTVLLTYSKKIVACMHKNSYLAISGIDVENRKAIHNHYKNLGLRCIKKYIGKEWCGYLYKKKRKSTLSRLVTMHKK